MVSQKTLFLHGWKISSNFRKERNVFCEQTDKAIFHWFVGKKSQNIPTDGIIKSLRIWLKNLKDWIVGSISGRKGIIITTVFYLFSFVLHWIFLQIISAIFLETVIFNLQGSCIPFPWPRLTSLPVIVTLQSVSWSPLSK